MLKLIFKFKFVYSFTKIIKQKIMKNLFKIKLLLLVSFLGVFLTSCDDEEQPVVTPDTTITGLAKTNANLSILVQALVKANLAVTLQGTGPFTVFAPTNAAFNSFLTAGGFVTNGAPDINKVPTDVLTQVLLNHVVSGSVQASGLVNDKYIKTLAKGTASIDNTLSMYVNTTTGVRLNGASSVITTTAGTTFNIIASNGVIHTVDAVIALPTIVTHALANPNFTSLVAVLTRAGNTTNFAAILGGTVSSPFTVFAPTNVAFDEALIALSFANLAAIPEPKLDKILKYHVIAGANVLAAGLPATPTAQNTFLDQTFLIGTTGGAKITDKLGRVANIVATDVQCANGVIHVLDKVIVPTL